MHKPICVILFCVTALWAGGQATSSKYQVGTITAVTAHQNAPGEAAEDAARYDVSVRIGNVVYVVLYTPPHSAKTVEYAAGMDKLFSVGSNTLTFYSQLSETVEVPILRREILPAEARIDWSKAPSQYFSLKQQHLSEALGLTDGQQARIKPILEQETAEAGQILWDPTRSRKDKFKRYEKIVGSSDKKIEPILSPTQLDKLQQLRRDQREEVKRLVAEVAEKHD